MQPLSKIDIPSDFSSVPGTTTLSNTASSGTTVQSEALAKVVYQTITETTTRAIKQLRQSFLVQDEDTLVALGKQQAKGLIEILDRLRYHNEEAAYQIALLFEPYLQTEQELDFSINLQPSVKFVAEVTRIKEPEPEFYFE